MIGPDSQAEATQKMVHRSSTTRSRKAGTISFTTKPHSTSSKRRLGARIESGKLFGFSFDVDPHVGGAVGNIYDYANAGAIARFGFELPDDYGPVRIEPSMPGSTSSNLPPASAGMFRRRRCARRGAEHLPGRQHLEESRHVDKLPFVGDGQLGRRLTFRDFRLTYTHVFRTKEFHTQPHSDQFGAIDLSVRF